MAITKLNSLAIPPNTIVESDLSYPLTNFSSTGIDDNATSTAITIDASENVGIGTASPTANLEISAATSRKIDVVDTTGARVRLSTASGQTFVGSTTAHPLNIITSDVVRATVDASGNVGIGTTSPTAYTGQTNLNINSGAVSRIDFDISNSLQGYVISESGYLGVIANTSNFLMLGAGSLERMRIDSSGNVGIGTTSPFSTARLQVKTGTNLNLAIQTGTTETSGMKINAFNDAATANIPLELNGSVTLLKTGETERMRVDSSGNVGIGESAPQYKLDINGANTAGNVDVAAFTNPVNAAGTGHGARILIHSTQNPSRGVGIASVSTSNYAADNAMAFYTSASSTLYERMRIDQYGNVSVRTTTGIGKLIGPRGNEVTVADDATVNLVINTAGACFIHAYDVGLGDGAVFFGTYKGGTTNIAAEGTHGWSTSDTDGNYCIYKSGNSHTITFKNRTGASRTMVFLVTAANTI
jgi:hypothetical protein